MGILDEDVARVRDQTDMVALIGEKVALRRVGMRYVGLCPFHQEKTPSFNVNPTLGFFHCLAGETRVITWDGVREIRELAGTTQRILTQQGRWVEAPFQSFGVQPLMKITIGRNRQRKEIYATAEHRWFVRAASDRRRETTTEQLKPGDPLAWSFTQGGIKQGTRLSPFGVARGIVFGDGARLTKGSIVDLHGEKNAELLKWFPLNFTYDYEREGKVDQDMELRYTKVVDLPAYFKDLPSLDESPSYLLGWLAGYFAADGCVAQDGTVILNSARRDNLEFVRMVCSRLGIGTYGITEQQRSGFKGREPSSLFRIHMINDDLREDFFLISEHRLRYTSRSKAFARRGWVVKSVEPTDRVEEVYCAVVPRYHSFTLEDNILTGNCFGCNRSGDAITFVREIDGLDFVDAIEELAKRAGITLRYDDRAQAKDRSRRGRLVEAVAAAIEYYHRLLLESERGGIARRYLRSRGFDGDAARQFVLGYSPDDWDRLSQHLQQERKLARDDIIGAGLAFVNKANRLQDQFRSRLMFPIYDAKGDAVGFGGRALGDDPAKYKNSPETPIYQKSRLLYGLNWAKGEIVAKGDVVICEGYTDVMAFALAGAGNAVATCGTALADDHVRMLKNFTRKATLAYDSDAAGQGAAEQWYRWEQEFDIQVRVADLPAGRDPADVWQDDPQRLLQALDDAQPFLQFRVDRAIGAADLATIEGKGRVAEEAAAIVAEHPSDLVRDQYVMQLSDRLGIGADRLRDAVTRASNAPRTPEPSRRRAEPEHDDEPPPPEPERPVARREVDLLRWAIHEPRLVADWLDEALFLDPTARVAFELLVTCHDFREAVDTAQGPVRALLERLAVEETMDDGEPETLQARLMVNAVEPVAKRLLVTMLRDDDDRGSDVKHELDTLAHGREVGDWESAQEAATRLVGWVVQESRARATETEPVDAGSDPPDAGADDES